MKDAEKIIIEMHKYLDKFRLKTNENIINDLIAFFEQKWAEADSGKYKIYDAYILIGRMINEYIRKKDFTNMMRWIEMGDLHMRSKENPTYIRNYYKGQCCLECGNEEKALEYFNLCYAENPDYIFSGAPFCYEFFNKHIEKPRELPELEEDDDDNEIYIELNYINKFLKGNEGERISVVLLNENSETVKEKTEEDKKTLDYIKINQEELLKSILMALLEEYPELQRIYDYPQEDKADFMPDVNKIEEFADLLSLYTIYVLKNKDKADNIGFLFGCSWDREHGLGIMTLNGKVQEIGEADVAFCR